MARWLELNQSYRPLQIYVRQIETTPVPFKHLCLQPKALTDLKTNLLMTETTAII